VRLGGSSKPEKGCRADGRVEQGEDGGAIRFQASMGASYY